MKLIISTLLFLSACNAESPLFQSTPPGTENVKSLRVVPVEDRDQPVVGTTLPLQVIGVNDDGSEIDITQYAIFETKDRKQATVEADGLVIGKNAGDFEISANFAGLKSSYKGSFFDSRIVSLAIQRAGVSIGEGGCRKDDPSESCGLAIGQSTTPRYIATFENKDRSNLRRSENLVVTKSSSVVGFETEGVLAKTIKALASGNYKITATYTNSFDPTDTISVETKTYKVVQDEPRSLFIEGATQALKGTSVTVTPTLVNISDLTYQPSAQTDVNGVANGICLRKKPALPSLDSPSCNDSTGDGFDDKFAPQIKTQSDGTYLFEEISRKITQYTIEYNPQYKTYTFTFLNTTSESEDFSFVYSQTDKDPIHKNHSFTIESNFSCMGFTYVGETKTNWLGTMCNFEDYTCDKTHYPACEDAFSTNSISLPNNYSVELQGYKATDEGTYWKIEEIVGKALFTSEDKSSIHINSRNNSLKTKSVVGSNIEIKMSYFGDPVTRIANVNQSSSTSDFKININSNSSFDDGSDLTDLTFNALIPNISDVISGTLNFRSFLYDINITDTSEEDYIYVESQNPARFVILPTLRENNYTGIPLTAGTATITATKIDGTSTSKTITISSGS